LSRVGHRLVIDYPTQHPLHESVVILRRVVDTYLEEGVRLGFALALTSSQSAHGWQAWGAAALELRQRSGCTEQAHCGELIDELRTLEAKFYRKP
ncbi:MAG TPA: hypothetical protein VGW38_15320, partial [Chloroflexota bacterium]|nr:hypothetical protein [Chloroflexota bacterium]